jgi:signal transduction histidine kinase
MGARSTASSNRENLSIRLLSGFMDLLNQQYERGRKLEAELAHVNRVSMLGELAASLSHELKQPIAAVILNAHASLRWLDREQPDLTEARKAILHIVNAAGGAEEIMDRLRSFYKTGTPPERELVDLNKALHEMLAMIRSEADRHSVSMRTRVATALPSIWADRVQIQQVLLNLMLNAIEAMKETGGELTVASELVGDGQVSISVSDTGVGLPAEKANQIFEAFFTTKPQGSGMGLAISRSIIESHGGRLWAAANSGRGATFYFNLPTAVEEVKELGTN